MSQYRRWFNVNSVSQILTASLASVTIQMFNVIYHRDKFYGLFKLF